VLGTGVAISFTLVAKRAEIRRQDWHDPDIQPLGGTIAPRSGVMSALNTAKCPTR